LNLDRRYLEGSLDGYLKELSGRTIVPGGGSAAALTAALGVSLNLMVINYSTGKGKDSPGDGIAAAGAKQQKSLDKLSVLIDKDCEVFSALMEKLSSEGDAEEEYKAAAQTPMDVCRECCASLEITAFLLENGNKNLLTDVGCASSTLNAAFDSARLNVEINLGRIKDESFLKDAKKMLSEMEKSIVARSGEIEKRVKDIMREKGIR
jgi:formiminotetrahydrofolate cyclodeaminase